MLEGFLRVTNVEAAVTAASGFVDARTGGERAGEYLPRGIRGDSHHLHYTCSFYTYYRVRSLFYH